MGVYKSPMSHMKNRGEKTKSTGEWIPVKPSRTRKPYKVSKNNDRREDINLSGQGSPEHQHHSFAKCQVNSQFTSESERAQIALYSPPLGSQKHRVK